MADEEEIQEDVSQEEEQVAEETEEQTVEETEEQAEEAAETQETSEEVAEDEPKKGFVSRYWMLGLGVLLAFLGVAAMVGLRTNFIQVYLLGYSDPSPGIGSQEYMGYGISIVPYALGLLLVMVWGRKTPELPDRDESEEYVEPAEEVAAEEEFGHEHLPPHHLSTAEKIEHINKAYEEGKMSKGLYEANLQRFEAERELENEAEEVEAEEIQPQKAEVAKNEEKHLPPHHLSPSEKIDHITKAYDQGKISKVFYQTHLKKYEAERKQEDIDAELDAQDTQGSSLEEDLDSLLKDVTGGESEKPRKKNPLDEI